MLRTGCLALCFALCLTALPTLAQDAAPRRPIPYPVIPPPSFMQAVEQGTRTLDGTPGPAYWTNTADYTIRATLSPETRMLRGEAEVRYQNNAPDTLGVLAVHLRQNLHREGATRNRPQQVTGGVHLARVAVEGTPMLENAWRRGEGYRVIGTVAYITLPEPLPPGASTTLSFAWSFEVPLAGAPRMGQDGEVFYLGYWYPQLAVYDDLRGWTADQYQGDGEFYMGYGTYDVAITVPPGWLVGATGTLENADEVLTPQTLARLQNAAGTQDIVSIVGPDERQTNRAMATDGPNTWRFRAENVRDFAFGTSDRYVWDATSATVGDLDGNGTDDTAMIHALYRPEAGDAWLRSARFAQFSIEHLSDLIVPYPYPHMTVVEGIIGGGMEYPMITLIGGVGRSEASLFGTTYHEISHMWFPMVVGQNEKAYAWMDEGLTSFNTNEGRIAFFERDMAAPGGGPYFGIAGTEDDVEPMRHSDDYPLGSRARVIASYSKPALALYALKNLVGANRFFEAYETYARRWAYKHPTPYDFFNTMEDVLGQDLDWFWTSMLYETWPLDHAVADVRSDREAVVVTVADEGLAPMPVVVRATYEDGTTDEATVPVETWLDGTTTQTTVRLKPGTVTRVELDPEAYLPDVDRADNTWTR